MTVRQLKQYLFDLIAEYFKPLKDAGNIVWGKHKPVNPNSPMVALTTGPITRAQRPIRMNVDGIIHDIWPSHTTLAVDLYTKGAPTTIDINVTSAMENTAVNDLTDFVIFMNSVYVDDWSYINDISVNTNAIHDLTALTNDTSWDYRAMTEIEIGFTQGAMEYAANPLDDGSGIASLPTHSGGRPQELADLETGWFEEVEIEYVKEENVDE